MDEEEEERNKELEEKQKKLEEEELAKDGLRRQKLGSKYRGPAYQLSDPPVRSPVRTPATSIKTKSPPTSSIYLRIPQPSASSSSTQKSPSTTNSKLAVKII